MNGIWWKHVAGMSKDEEKLQTSLLKINAQDEI